MARTQNAATPVNLMTMTSNSFPLNKRRPSGMSVEPLNGVILINVATTKIADLTNNQAIGRKNCKRRDLGLSNHSCPNSRIQWLKVSLKLLNRMQPLRACPHPLWEAKTPRPIGMKVAKENDCLLEQFIHQPGLQIPIRAVHLTSHPNPNRGTNWPTKLILMQTHAASATTSPSLNSQPNKLTRMPVMNQSSPSQMHQLCPAPLPGMIQQLVKPAFWLQMKRFVMAPNWITPQSTQTKFEALVLIVGTTLW